MNFEELQKAREELEEKTKVLLDDMKEKVKEYLVDHFKPLFEKYPQVKALKWTQYTPYFNDGDACTFRSNHDYCDFIGENGYSYDDGEFDLDNKIVKEFYDHFPNISDDDMETFFGDHIYVELSPNGITTEEYSHD